MSKKYFGTDGIRGKVNQGNINGEMFFKFGLAAGTYFKNLKKNKQIAIIAKDTRLSGYTHENIKSNSKYFSQKQYYILSDFITALITFAE